MIRTLSAIVDHVIVDLIRYDFDVGLEGDVVSFTGELEVLGGEARFAAGGKQEKWEDILVGVMGGM